MLGYCIWAGLLDAQQRMLAEVGSTAAFGWQAISRTQCANFTRHMPLFVWLCDEFGFHHNPKLSACTTYFKQTNPCKMRTRAETRGHGPRPNEGPSISSSCCQLINQSALLSDPSESACIRALCDASVARNRVRCLARYISGQGTLIAALGGRAGVSGINIAQQRQTQLT